MKPLFFYIFLTAFFFISVSYKPLADKDTYIIWVDKSEAQLKVTEGEECLVTYPIVLGNQDLGDKMMQGDKKTPEGSFRIATKYKHAKWHRFMLLDYPTKEDIQKFKERKEQGLIPSNAKIGGGIGIHGTWPHEDYAIDRRIQWTEGCVATKNQYIQKLFEVIPVGTEVIIQQ